MALRAKWLAFVEEYLKSGNKTRAAAVAGYAHPGQAGYRLFKNVQIQAHIQQRLEERAMGADEVLARLGDQARGSIEDFIEFKPDIKQPYLNLIQAKERNLLHLIKKLKYDAQGHLEIELYDAQSALTWIGKHHKLFTEKLEVVGLEDVLRSLPDEFREAVRQELAGLIRQE